MAVNFFIVLLDRGMAVNAAKLLLNLNDQNQGSPKVCGLPEKSLNTV
jgi:hypothetical protein